MHKYDWIKDEKSLDIDRNFWEKLSKEAYPITKGEIRIPISLEPFILEAKEYKDLEKDITLVTNAARKIAEAYYIDPAIKDVLSIDEKEKELIDLAEKQNFVGVMRIDLFYADRPRIVEINSDYPDGFFMHDVTAKALSEFTPNLNINTKNHSEIFTKLLKSEGVTENMHIFIGYDEERTFVDEFHLTKNKLTKLGWKNVSVGTFKDLIFKKGSFYFNDLKIDVLRRGSELSKIRTIPDFIPRLIEAEKNGLLVINNFKMRLLGYKSLLAALWDERFHKYLTSDEIDSIKKILPETYKLDSVKINKEILLNNKNIWVIKPIDLTEGADVFVGEACTPDEWSIALSRAYTNPQKWIAQHKVEIPSAIFNIIENNHSEISSHSRRFDCNPHIILFKDKVELGNILVRFSESQILNVAKGGGITYAFPLKD
ncbi:MAG: hypothetical protein WCW14_04500 [Candidatus Paceibacterota bacterium]|jgi:hypothetical protein